MGSGSVMVSLRNGDGKGRNGWILRHKFSSGDHLWHQAEMVLEFMVLRQQNNICMHQLINNFMMSLMRVVSFFYAHNFFHYHSSLCVYFGKIFQIWLRIILWNSKRILDLIIMGKFIFSHHKNRKKVVGTENLFLYRQIFVSWVFIRT